MNEHAPSIESLVVHAARVQSEVAREPRAPQLLDDLQPEIQERLAEILDSYLENLQRGSGCTAADLIKMHPDLADPLRRYLESLNLLQQAASVCQAKVESTPTGQLGDFQILSELGRGGMGIVYQARQVSLGRLVALKILPFAAVLDPKQVARFQNEAQAAAQLHHSHIVPVYAVGCERGVHYYSMQFIDGQSLDRALTELRSLPVGTKTAPLGNVTSQPDSDSQRGRVSPRRGPQRDARDCVSEKKRGHDDSRPAGDTAVRGFTTQRSIRSRNYVRSAVELIIDAAEAIHFAHECGVIHRDIKPSNLLIDRHGELWVTDFGLARCQNLTNITATGDFFGTLRYMSPEQTAGRMAFVDHRSDIYSLGVTLYEMLTLQAPFESADRAELLRMIVDAEPSPPRRLNSAIPTDLETILLKTLCKSPAERYSTAEEFAADLRRFLAGEPTHARRPTLLDHAGKWVARHAKVVAAGFLMALSVTAIISTAMILLAREQQRSQSALHQAELHLRVAREVVDNLGARLSEDLAAIPGTESVRLQALEQAQGFYRDFVRYAVDQPKWQRDVATAAFKRGAILEKLGRTKEALECYREARRLFAVLAGDAPDDSSSSAQAALCENNIGLINCRENHTAGIPSLRTAVSELAALTTRFPHDEHLRNDLHLVRLNLGLELSKMGRNEEARQLIVESVTHTRELVSRSPDNLTMLRRLAVGLSYLGGLETDRQEATRGLQESISLHRELIEHEPNRIEHQSELAAAMNQLGSLRMDSGNAESALTLFEGSLTIQRRLVTQSPLVDSFRIEVATVLNNLGMAHLDTDLMVAERQFEESLSLLRELVRKVPADDSLRSKLAAVINNRGLVSERQGKIREAISAFHQAIAEQELVIRRSGEAPTHREQLERLQSNLVRALHAEQQRTPDASLGTVQDIAPEPPANSGNAT